MEVYRRLDMIETDHPGKRFIRKLLGSFTIQGPHGTHLCLVHEPLGPSLHQTLDLFPGRKLSADFFKSSLRQILMAIDFLHAQAGIIHTDLQSNNMLLGVRDPPAVFSVFEEAELSKPGPRKVLTDRTIYRTRRTPLTHGLPFLCDFGEARFTDDEAGVSGQNIMPDVYKAPEIILQMKWDCKVDIWNVAMVLWHVLTGAPLFKGRSLDGTFQDDRVHLGEMVALMGPPPPEFLQRSEMCRAVWNDDGSWKDVVPVPDMALEKLVDNNITVEDKEGFLRFFRRMLCWLPEERPTGEELVFDPWLMKGLGQD